MSEVKINLEKIVYDFPTKNVEGFTGEEQRELLTLFPKINMAEYNDALSCVTGQMIDNEFITYHNDIVTALKCGLENRKPKIHEWD
jgi:hypothetical protein